MKMLCFATGNLWRLVEKVDIMELISELDIDGVEYTYGKQYAERKLMEKDYDILNKYKGNSIHWPFKLSLDLLSLSEFEYFSNKIFEDYKRINANGIVIHPPIVLPNKMPKMNYVTENLNPKKGANRPRDGFEKILNERTDWGLCLDVSHAYDWDPDETERIVKKWKHRIKQVHFSNNRYHKDHLPFEKVSPSFLKSIEPLQELNVPIIIEESMPYTKLSDIKKEIKRVRDILSL